MNSKRHESLLKKSKPFCDKQKGFEYEAKKGRY